MLKCSSEAFEEEIVKWKMKANDFEEKYLSVVKDLSDQKQQLDESRNTLKSIHDSLLCLMCKGLLADECSVL